MAVSLADVLVLVLVLQQLLFSLRVHDFSTRPLLVDDMSADDKNELYACVKFAVQKQGLIKHCH